MAYQSNDIQEVITSIDTGMGNALRVSTVKDKNTNELKAIDIRNWYLADNNEMQPTKKGVRIKSENLADVLTSMLLSCGYEVITDICCNSGIDIELPNNDSSDEDFTDMNTSEDYEEM